MDFKQIKELIKLVDDSKIGEVLIETDDSSIRIRHLNYQKKSVVTQAVAPQSTTSFQAPQVEQAPSDVKSTKEKTKDTDEDESEKEEELNNEHLVTVKSPMIGTFYRSGSPDKPPYVKVGDNINKQDVICIIEAMKLFNEIESEFSGKIVKVLVENESPVEYDQPLFLIDPKG
ncbi:MAG: acetyl-CoA carboxylase biotin carboxyl carrier protein [Chitinophagales bacterium]